VSLHRLGSGAANGSAPRSRAKRTRWPPHSGAGRSGRQVGQLAARPRTGERTAQLDVVAAGGAVLTFAGLNLRLDTALGVCPSEGIRLIVRPMVLPSFPSTIGKRGKLVAADGSTMRFTVIDEVSRVQSRHSDGSTEPRYMLILQRIRFDSGVTELRAGYYITHATAGSNGGWLWSRSSLIAPEEDFIALVEEARERGWFGT